ncbi:HAD family hydrolase [Shewanella sp.]|uniref:HAD family hydrolase n=1 Tax=Shewanella sp. TaxID=50422 RepID=UPI003567EB97
MTYAGKGAALPQFQRPLQLSHIDAVVFDLDGTLAHSNPDFPAMRAALGLASGADILAHVQSLPAAAQPQALNIVHQFELEAAANASWIDGAAELLNWLHGEGLPTAVLTRNMREAARHTLSRLGLDVDVLLTREDAPAKPDPTGLWQIATAWQLPPARVLYVGDYLFDLQTAARAGCPSALYCPQQLPPFASMADMLVPCYFGLIEAFSVSRNG